MNVRRFMLRLAVGLLCFAVGWASAVLLGSTRRAHTVESRRVRTELIIVPHTDPVTPPHFEMPPAGPSCGGRLSPRHAHEWHDVPRPEEFAPRFEAPPPPPRPKPHRPAR